jgi:hypothetical protein
MNNQIRDTDYICRLEKGGCGRRIALVAETYQRTCGFARSSGQKPVGVHEDEVGERQVIKASRALLLRERARLEDSCAARAEAARMRKLEQPAGVSAASGR